MTRPTLEQERNTALLSWYTEHGRVLPWRTTTNPYPILISEVMSQQTQIQRVVPMYKSFLSQFPTVESLADAPLRNVITAWSGLGYNSRAERLHRTAKHIAGNGWPDTISGLEQLPGIGPYTARAIAAFAFGEKVAALDTNLRRVISRWHGAPLTGVTLQQIAEKNITEDPSTWNQAVMDLGASFCRPRLPRCSECPVKTWCAGPEAYQPSRPRSRFEGSLRQVRGSVIRTLVQEPSTFDQLVHLTGSSRGRVGTAVEQLIGEGLVERADDHLRLPE